MKLYPSSADQKLGFDALRERLEMYARSSMGKERLAQMRPADNPEWLRAELERVAELQEAFRFDDPLPLDHVLDVREVIRRASPENAFVEPDDLLAVLLVLVTLRRVKNYLEARSHKYPRLAEAAGRIRPLPDVEKHIERVVDQDGRLRDDASPELRRLRQLILRRQARLRDTLQEELRKAIGQGHATEEQPTIRNGRMVIPVRAEAKRRVQGFVQDVSATGQTVYIEPAACLDLNNEVRELIAEEHREVERILREATARLQAHIEPIRENLRALAQFDLLQAKARLSNELNAVVPKLNSQGIIDIRKGRNPVLLLRFQKEENEAREVVPLQLTLGDTYRTLIITGPNAGGKTVAMKTVGLFALMIAYGLPIPVDPLSSFCFFEHIIVDIGDEQSIEEDLSTFSSHVANLKYMLKQAGEKTLILIDEAGTGTDPAEGGALAQAVLEQLTRAGARTIATTHHGTLKVFAHESEGVENGSMQFDQATLSPTYRFQERVPGSSYAFEISQRIGLQPQVLERARNLVGRQKTSLEELIASFEARNQELEQRLSEATQIGKQLEEERNRYEERARVLREDRDEIRRKALDEAEQIVRQANAAVERTIREIREAQADRETTRAAREQLERLGQTLQNRKQKAEHRRERARRVPTPSRQESGARTPKPIQVGDQVVLDGGSTAAEVLEIQDGEALIAFGSMRMRARLDRLQKVGGPRKQQVTVRQVQHGAADLSSLRAQHSLDLRGRRVEEALQEVMRLLDEAIAANLAEVEILHGKGTGALRTAIHEYLAGRRDVAGYEDAPWNQGGPGVTHVTLK